MTQSRELLRRILLQVAEMTAGGSKSLVVFDLDSTLFDVSPRLEKILMEFAEVPEHRRLFPEQVARFDRIKTLRSDWGIQGALIRAGLDGHHPDFQAAVKDFWQERFFNSRYLPYDLPYDGAVPYVQAIARSGADIAYLTGRDVARMGTGSEQVLRDWNFPLQDGKAELVLKPHRDMNDALFKKEWFDRALGSGYERIWFFENEPVNIHLIRAECPAVEVVFMDSTHAGKAEPPRDLATIMDYLCDLHG